MLLHSDLADYAVLIKKTKKKTKNKQKNPLIPYYWLAIIATKSLLPKPSIWGLWNI